MVDGGDGDIKFIITHVSQIYFRSAVCCCTNVVGATQTANGLRGLSV